MLSLQISFWNNCESCLPYQWSVVKQSPLLFFQYNTRLLDYNICYWNSGTCLLYSFWLDTITSFRAFKWDYGTDWLGSMTFIFWKRNVIVYIRHQTETFSIFSVENYVWYTIFKKTGEPLWNKFDFNGELYIKYINNTNTSFIPLFISCVYSCLQWQSIQKELRFSKRFS